MNDQVITELERQCQQQPEDLALRFRWYQALIRAGRATERALLLATNHGDEAAQWGLKTWRKSFVQTHEDLVVLAQLPVRTLYFYDEYEPEDRDFDILQGLPLTKLQWNQFEEELQECPLSKLRSKAFESLKIRSVEFNAEDFSNLRLDRLKKLDVGNPIFSGACLQVLKESPLECLSVYGGTVHDEDLQHLSQLPLKSMKLSNLPISDLGLRSLSNLRLRDLDLSCNKIDGSGFESLDTSKLESLSISSTSLSPKAFAAFAKAPLKTLSLWHLLGDSYELQDMNDCPIEEFSISASNIQDESLSVLQHWPLRALAIEHCNQLTDKVLETLSGEHLEELNLYYEYMTGCGFQNLRQSPLKSVQLTEMPRLQSAWLKVLKNCPIESFSLQTNTEFPTQDLMFLGDLPLNKLYLTGHTHCSVELLRTLRACPLREFSMPLGQDVSDQDFECLQPHPLTHLSISRAVFEGHGLKHISKAPLQSLSFWGCPNWAGAGLHFLETQCLEELKISGCQLLEDRAFQAISRLSPRRLAVNDAPNLTNKIFRILKDSNIDQMMFTHCPGLTQEACAQFFENKSAAVRH